MFDASCSVLPVGVILRVATGVCVIEARDQYRGDVVGLA